MWFDRALVSSAVVSTLMFTLVAYKLKSRPAIVNLMLGVTAFFGLYIFSALIHRDFISIPLLLYGRIFDGTNKSVLVLLSLIFCNYVSYTKYSSTVHRKFFHLTASLVCASGLFYDAELLWLSAAIVLCIFVILEVLRSLGIAPWAEYLNSSFLVFLDKQDSPFLILTPIYLVFGIFLPVFLRPLKNTEPRHLSHYAGILTVGIGDSLAAVVGSLYGRHFWPNSHKSYEGSLAMMVSQVIFAFLFVWYENALSFNFYRVCRILASSLVCTYAEAKLYGTDNIVLPFIAYFIL